MERGFVGDQPQQRAKCSGVEAWLRMNRFSETRRLIPKTGHGRAPLSFNHVAPAD